MDRLLTASQPPSLLRFCESTFHKPLHPWQREHLIPLLESLAHTKGRKILIHAPPQFGKSVWVSQRFPAWLLGVDPEHRFRLACYNVTKATQFGASIVNLMQDARYAEWFGPGSTIKAGASAQEFSTAARQVINDAQPSFKALGLESGFTGSGADTLAMDDPYASAAHAISEAYEAAIERFWTGTAVPRLSEETNVLAMFHRYHAGDFAQRRLDEGGWEYYRFPALGDANEDGSDPTDRQPEEPLSSMRSRAYLVKLREDDPDTFAGQFQGRPNAIEGTLFREEWFGHWEGAVPPLRRWVRAWDLATSIKTSGDYTVGALIGKDTDGTIIVRDVVRFRAEWPDACDRIIQVAKEDGPDVPVVVEATAFQLAAVQTLGRNEHFERVEDADEFRKREDKGERFVKSPLLSSYPKGDKKERASGWAWFAARGKLKMCPGAWHDDFIKECKVFDGLGLVHDDQVDAVSAAWALISQIRGGRHIAKHLPQPGSPEFYRQLQRNSRAS